MTFPSVTTSVGVSDTWLCATPQPNVQKTGPYQQITVLKESVDPTSRDFLLWKILRRHGSISRCVWVAVNLSYSHIEVEWQLMGKTKNIPGKICCSEKSWQNFASLQASKCYHIKILFKVSLIILVMSWANYILTQENADMYRARYRLPRDRLLFQVLLKKKSFNCLTIHI